MTTSHRAEWTKGGEGCSNPTLHLSTGHTSPIHSRAAKPPGRFSVNHPKGNRGLETVTVSGFLPGYRSISSLSLMSIFHVLGEDVKGLA